jgi:uncharacterized membrane protein YdjX (TVP38/TMEM64 family)
MLFFQKGTPMAWFDEAFRIMADWVAAHGWLAPFLAFGLPFLEAALPPLPLTLIVGFLLGILSAAYGTLAGTIATILIASLGSASGMFLIFALIRKTITPSLSKTLPKHPVVLRFLKAVDDKQSWMVFAFLANPFLPSSILNYLLALSPMSAKKYTILTASSRIVVIASLVFLGSLLRIQEHPWNLLWMMLFYGLLFWIHALVSRQRTTSS